MMFYLDLRGKKFCQKILRLINFKQNSRHLAMEAEALRVDAEAEAVQKLPLPHIVSSCNLLPH